MKTELQILSEYIDGELPVDVSKQLESRLRSDQLLSQKLDSMRSIGLQKTDLNQDAAIQQSSERIWLRLQSRLADKRQPVSRINSLVQILKQKISIPLPALAAMAVVVFALTLFSLPRATTSGPNEDSISNNRLELPRDLVSSDSFPSRSLVSDSATQTYPSANDSTVQVTFEVQNINELLNLLEGNGEIRELSIKLPQLKSIPKSREPVLIHSSDLVNASFNQANGGVRR